MLTMLLTVLVAQAGARAPSPRACPAATPVTAPTTKRVLPCPSPSPALAVIASVKAKGRIDNLIGTAGSASEGNASYTELQQRPIQRPGELLETIPGLIISQHSGEGKANQYYLRGFNLDHGTDIAITVGGVPANMRTHAHGQGYADINWVIPELISYVNYRKGPYFAEEGDFSTAGAANMYFFDTLPHAISTVAAGPFGQSRFLYAQSPRVGNDAHILYALEYLHDDNTGHLPDNFRKYSTFVRYSHDTNRVRFNVTEQTYDAHWHSSDQIPLRAVQQGIIDRFGQIDPTDGGRTFRHVLSADYVADNGKSLFKSNAYFLNYGLHLFSDFTYFFEHQDTGDQFEQLDNRVVTGINLSNSWHTPVAENTIGYQFRSDNISPVALYGSTGQHIVRTKRIDRVVESSSGLYLQTEQHFGPRFRGTFGLRGDSFVFLVRDLNPLNSGTVHAGMVNPKVALAFTASKNTELYADFGESFHSNDARGVTETPDPATPLVRAMGSELGVRFASGSKLRTTLALWNLRLASELIFSGDAGTTAPGRPSFRDGIEIANFFAPSPGTAIDFDYASSSAKFTNDDPVGRHIPGSVAQVFSFGYTVDAAKTFGSIRVRYFGPRPLIEDASVSSNPTTTISLQAGIKMQGGMRLGFDVFNLLNAKASDIDYYYNSYLPSDPYYTNLNYAGPCPARATCGQGVFDVHFHPIVSRLFRFTLSKPI